MPPKKRPYDSLTGGTGDVSPQTYVIKGNFSALGGGIRGSSIGSPLPIPRYSAGIDKAIVMEILSTEFQVVDPPNVITTASGDFYKVALSLTTNPNVPGSMEELVGDGRSISILRRTAINNGIVADNMQFDLEEYDDLTDQAGHGILVATDNIYLATYSTVLGYNWVSDFYCKILYRMKEVKLAEYIGIVQSQQ